MTRAQYFRAKDIRQWEQFDQNLSKIEGEDRAFLYRLINKTTPLAPKHGKHAYALRRREGRN